MPIYEYSCSKCDSVIERIQKFSDPLLKKHEGCGGTLTKLISQSSFHLKGSGWYVTDYASKDSKGDDDAGDTKNDKSKSDSNKDGDKKAEGGTTDSTTPSEKKVTPTTSKKTTKAGSSSGTKK